MPSETVLQTTLKPLVCKLQHNEEALSKEELNTRYKSAYLKLKKDIHTAFVSYVVAVQDEAKILIHAEDEDVIFDLVTKMYANDGYAKLFGTALYKHYDMEEVQQLVHQMFESIKSLIDSYYEQQWIPL